MSELDQRIAEVRRFNRFYTRAIGVLPEGHLQSPFSLTEVRLLYELAHQEGLTASNLGKELGLDAGYLSRLLRGFEQKGYLVRRPSQTDGRQSLLALTEAGRSAFAPLNAAARDEIGALLRQLPEAGQARLITAMRRIEELLSPAPARAAPYLLRPHQPGDMGWVIARHGLLYWQEYRFDMQFEALVAKIAGAFIESFDPRFERCWIAERDRKNVGSVFVVKHSDSTAKLRLLLVEPDARGLGIGARLVAECIRFAREAGYAKLSLWTNSILLAARHLYVQAGFQLVDEAPHHSFGRDLVGETWELRL
jgi:DNA-binding MarR family transcriptional regulator/N-acetylglutamate synthase-like GNAT family acetyltransferase